jgi:toxin ParE1/3/4
VARRLVLTLAAEGDLAEQVDYLGVQRPAAARRYVLALHSAFDRLLGMPELGARRSYPVPGCENVRIWPVPGFRRFVIVYRATRKTVEVIRVLHSARDISRVLKRS